MYTFLHEIVPIIDILHYSFCILINYLPKHAYFFAVDRIFEWRKYSSEVWDPRCLSLRLCVNQLTFHLIYE